MKAPVQSSTAAPERSLDQRMEALNKANNIRSKRAKLKRDLKAGKVEHPDPADGPAEYVETAKVLDMLLAVPKYGRVKTNRILNQCRISPSKTIGGLSERQRSELVHAAPQVAHRSRHLCRERSVPPPRLVSARGSEPRKGLRDHGALRGREGDPDREAARRRPRAGAVGLGDHPRPEAGGGGRARLPLPHRGGVPGSGWTPETSWSTRPTAATATGPSARRWTERLDAGPLRRPRDRGPGGEPGPRSRCPRRSRSSSRRRTPRCFASGSSGRATDSPEEIEKRLGRAEVELEAQVDFPHGS